MSEEKVQYSIKEYILFKLDRTIAILGLVGIAVGAMLFKEITEPAAKIVSGVAGALAVYVGGRGGTK